MKDFNYRQIDMVIAKEVKLPEVIEDYTKLGYAVGVKPRTYKEVLSGDYFTEYMVVIYKEEEERKILSG